MKLTNEYIVAYVTKCDNITRYYKTEILEKALSAIKEFKKYKNLFKKIRLINN